MSLHSITDTMIKTAETNAETIASQDRTIHNLTFLLSGARQTIDELRTELATANATIAQLNDNLYEAAQVADTDNETVAALVSQIEDEKIVALRAELAAANAKPTDREEVLFALLFAQSGHRWLAQEADNQGITLNQFFINEIKEAFSIAVESDGFVELKEETVAAVFHDITGGDFAEFMKGEG